MVKNNHIKKVGNMGFVFILAGLVFFFNPCINIIDVLPDFIGAILIAVGLHRLSDVEDRFAEARRVSVIMIGVYIAKFLLSFYLMARWKSGLLPFTFIFSSGEALLFILLFTKLFGAIEYMANLHDGDKCLPLVSDTAKFSIFFSITKVALAFIPEAFALEKEQSLDFSFDASPLPTLTEAKPFAVVLFTIVVFGLGIYFLVLNFKFFRTVISDKKFISNMRDIYRERVLLDPKLVAARKFRRYFMLLMFGVVFLFDFTVDAVNILPDFVGYTFIFIAYLCIGGASSRRAVIIYPILMVSSVASYIYKFMCDKGINHIMGYESYFSERFLQVETGGAIAVASALVVIENVLFVIFCATVFSYAKNRFSESCPGELPMVAPTVVVAIQALLSSFVYVAPVATAKFFSEYINDSFLNMKSLTISENINMVHYYVLIALVIYTFGMVIYFGKMREHAKFEL